MHHPAWTVIVLFYVFVLCPFIGSVADRYINAVFPGLAITALFVGPVLIMPGPVWAIQTVTAQHPGE